MKCIDAIEGTVQCIIKEMYAVYTRNSADDSEYIYNVKAIIDATDQYVRSHPEFIDTPDILKHVLYVYARSLWLMGQQPETQVQETKAYSMDSETEEYQTYYFDYIYNRGVYPG